MASPLLIVRAVAGLAMPAAIGVAYIRQRRSRPKSDPAPTASVGLASLDRQSTLALLQAGEDVTSGDLSGHRLRHADLSGRRIIDTDFSHTWLQGANLRGVDLSGSRLDHADLSKADLRGAVLDQVIVTEASLWGADLRGADLSGARNLVTATLRRAWYDSATRFPPGFDPERAGMRAARLE